jgi:hypothetical protein
LRIGKNSLQTIINNYCKSKGEEVINWKDTGTIIFRNRLLISGLPNLSVVLNYLETRSHVDLSSSKTEIVAIHPIKKIVSKRRRNKENIANQSERKQTSSSNRSIPRKKKMKQTTNSEIEIQTQPTDLSALVPTSTNCPVCNKALENMNSQKLNSHIDECLNLLAISQENEQSWDKKSPPSSKEGSLDTSPGKELRSPSGKIRYLGRILVVENRLKLSPNTAIIHSECRMSNMF